jgi:hypothetical protein
VAREEREAESKVGAREDSEGLDEDVGDGLIAGEVRVELVTNDGIVSNCDFGKSCEASSAS